MTNNLKFLIYLLTILILQGCGGGDDSETFDSIEGRWQIDAQELTQFDCPFGVGGFSDVVSITMNGSSITMVSSKITSETGFLTFTGSQIPNGAIAQAVGGASCGGSGQTNYTLSIENIPPDTNAIGQAHYSYESVCGDGTVACRFTVSGAAQHISEG